RRPSGLNVGDRLSEKRPTVKRCKQQSEARLYVYTSVPSSFVRENASVLASGEKTGVQFCARLVGGIRCRSALARLSRYSRSCPWPNSVYTSRWPLGSQAGDNALGPAGETGVSPAPSLSSR